MDLTGDSKGGISLRGNRMRSLLIPLIAAGLGSAGLSKAADPTSATSVEELSKLFPRAKQETFSLGKQEVVVLHLYKGSCYIHQVLHIFSRHKSGNLAWKFSAILNSRKGVIKVSRNGTQLEITTEKGKTVAVLDASLMGYDKSEFLSR